MDNHMYGNPIMPQQNATAEYWNRKTIDTNLAVEKEWRMNEAKLSLAYRKMSMQEWRKEQQKTRHESVAIAENGEIKRTVENAIVKVPECSCVNFQVVCLVEVVSTEGDEGLYQLRLRIGQKVKTLVLDAKKMGSPIYFGRKLTEAGAVILLNKRRDRESFLVQLWSLLLSLCKERILAPTCVGWNKIRGKFKFVEEEAMLWKEMQKSAK